jgi:DNA-binding response OmpR family regulator
MRLLMVEDDPRLSDALSTALRRRDFVVDAMSTLEDARYALGQEQYRAVVLDRRLPDGDGISLVKDVLALTPRPCLLMLTAQASSADVVSGLNAGADDYLAKPFEVDVLVARLFALLRRPAPPDEAVRSVGNLTFDFLSRQVKVAGSPVELPRRELLLLEALMERPGSVTTLERIMTSLYGIDDEVQPSAVQTHVSRLRTKLKVGYANVEIIGLRGIGYVIK